MKFEKDSMYKNIYKDPDTAFFVDEVLSQDSDGAHLKVTWYKKNENNRYLQLNFNGDLYIPKSMLLHYVDI